MLSNIDILALPAPEPDSPTKTKIVTPKEYDDGYIELMDEFSLHQFIIRKGKTLDQTPEFISFKRTYINQWAGISFMIHQLEKFLMEYGVPNAIINGKELAYLANQSRKPTKV